MEEREKREKIIKPVLFSSWDLGHISFLMAKAQREIDHKIHNIQIKIKEKWKQTSCLGEAQLFLILRKIW